MKTLTFQGYSDDTFDCTGDGVNVDYEVDYEDAASGKPISMLVVGAGGMCIVTGQYCPGQATGWLIGVAPCGDDTDPMPEWPMRLMAGDNNYSVKLEIDAPNNVKVTLVDPNKENW